MHESTPDAPAGEIPAEEFHRVQRSPEFAHLKRTFRSFAFPMTAVFLVWYFAYVLASIFAKDLMMTSVAGNLTVGILFDTTRYAGSDDPVEWDVFRTAIHESQGWRLHRFWTPHLFRDPEGAIETVAQIRSAPVVTHGARHPFLDAALA